ncbi:MAG: DUF4194 domain-containing protein [Opitutales bacterium]|nr:DUF4194 domain-containing protein [Opitutales bacterium]
MSARIDHRHVLARLATGPLYEGDTEYWRALKSDPERVSAHFAEMGLTLVIDESGGYAYLRQADEDADEGWTESGLAPLPRILRRTPLSYHQTIFLVLLRERLLQHDQSPDSDAHLFCSVDDLTDWIRPYFPESNNEKKLMDSVHALIRRFQQLGLLTALKNRSEPIYRVEPIIKAKLPPDKIEEVRARLTGEATTGEAKPADTTADDDTDDDTTTSTASAPEGK